MNSEKNLGCANPENPAQTQFEISKKKKSNSMQVKWKRSSKNENGPVRLGYAETRGFRVSGQNAVIGSLSFQRIEDIGQMKLVDCLMRECER